MTGFTIRVKPRCTLPSQTVEFYEADVDSREELPLFAIVEDSGFVYIRDNRKGEYVMWSVNEWVYPKAGVDFDEWNRSDKNVLEDSRTSVNEDVVGAVFNGIRLAYQEPDKLKGGDWSKRVQL